MSKFLNSIHEMHILQMQIIYSINANSYLAEPSNLMTRSIDASLQQLVVIRCSVINTLT